MLKPFVIAGVLAALGTVAVAAAQTPGPTSSPVATATGGTPSPTSSVTPPRPTASPTPTPIVTPGPIVDFGPGEPAFNYDIVKEVVVPLTGADGRTHYVTMSQDTAGIVRFRFSLFNFPRGFYQVYVMSLGKCGPEAMTRRVGELFLRGDVPVAQLHAVQQPAEGELSLVLYFENTDQVSVTAASPKSIYDADGTALILAGGPFVADPTPIAACAVLAAPPGAPDTGSGEQPAESTSSLWSLEGIVAALLLIQAAAWGRVPRR